MALKILLAGSTGYIGRRLKARLLHDENISIRLFVRDARKGDDEIRAAWVNQRNIEISEGDILDKKSLKMACAGVDVAYYLVRHHGKDDYTKQDDIKGAQNFRDACIESGVKMIVALDSLPENISDRRSFRGCCETGKILSARPEEIRTLIFRCGTVFGAGSSAFETVFNLAEKLPFLVAPNWSENKRSFIYIEDLISYLAAAIGVKIEKDITVDIGSFDLKFSDIFRTTARLLSRKIPVVRVPFFLERISSFLISMYAPVDYRTASDFIKCFKHETISDRANAEKYFSHIVTESSDKSVCHAIEESKSGNILSRWCDTSSKSISEMTRVPWIKDQYFLEKRSVSAEGISGERLFESFIKIGGTNGWFGYDFLWKMRGFFDKILGGCGLNRGRRSSNTLRIGDAVDFWRVADVVPGKRLLLFAEMKLPGRAWLEFFFDGGKLQQTAYFEASGLFGRIYWYAMLPFHILIFGNMAETIVRKAYKNVESKGTMQI